MLTSVARKTSLTAYGLALIAVLQGLSSSCVQAQGLDLEQAPILYTESKPDNPLTRLQDELDRGTKTLKYDPQVSYLPSLLEALGVPVDSQTLVFSKTSLQRQRISPRSPRAIYFNDEVYVGYCRMGEVLELSVADPKLGTVFYTMDQAEVEKPSILRQGDSCLICHGSSMNHGYPGHLVRSVFPDAGGNPILSVGTARVDHTTPFVNRWGGWYATGQSGQQVHRGNQTWSAAIRQPPEDLEPGRNIEDLSERFPTRAYLSPHSDLVALLVFEHQSEGHNRIVRANFETRMATHQQADFDRILVRHTEGLSDSTRSRIKAACEPLVKYLFFSKEAPLAEPVSGSSTFAKTFAARGPFDRQGRSLRQFDLQTRLFRYPLSYLIYNESIKTLPVEAKDYLRTRFTEILSGHDQTPEFAHLTPPLRQEILEIVQQTYPDLYDARLGEQLRQATEQPVNTAPQGK